jgi:hypothetical protein
MIHLHDGLLLTTLCRIPELFCSINMTIIRAGVILFIVALSASAVDLSWYVDVGGNASYINPTLPPEITLRHKSVEPFIAGGAGLQLHLNDFFRIKSGLFYEHRACKIDGHGRYTIIAGLWVVDVDGSYTFTYDYIQLPLHLVGVMPMLFPGNIYLSAGPEFGVPLASQQRVAIDSAGTPKWDTTFDARANTRSYDFGLSGEIGYEFPFGKYLSAAAYAGYYWGILDIYKAATASAVGEAEIYTRSFRFGVRFDANLFTMRK